MTLKKEAAAKAAAEAAALEAANSTPPAGVFGEAADGSSDLGPTPPEAPSPTPGEKVIFGQESINHAEQKPEMTMMPKAAVEAMMAQIAELQKAVYQPAIDPHDQSKKKKIIKVPFYKNDEGVQYIVTGLMETKGVDGSVAQTWQRDRDPLTKQPITWCKPILIDIDTKVMTNDKEFRYDEFTNTIQMVALEVVNEETVPVNLTTHDEEVEVVSYTENKSYLRPQSTGVMTKVTVWGVRTSFTIEYQGTQYKISEAVVNYK